MFSFRESYCGYLYEYLMIYFKQYYTKIKYNLTNNIETISVKYIISYFNYVNSIKYVAGKVKYNSMKYTQNIIKINA